jgi:hypothetical protein
MRAWLVSIAVGALAGALILGTGACGSGGGGAVVAGDPLAGTYFLAIFTAEDGMPDTGRCLWGTFDADGSGVIGGGLTSSNENGMVSGPMSSGSGGDYVIGAGNRISIIFGGMAGLTGGIAPDGGAAALSSAISPLSPAWYLMCRREGSFGLGSLTGVWHFVLFAYDAAAMKDVARWGKITFDGGGGAAVMRMNNVSGAVSTTLPAVGNYFVGGDGTLDFTLVGEPFKGGICAGGDLAILGGSTMAGGNPSILLLVRGSAAATAATFAGTYHAVAFEAPVGGVPEWRSVTTTMAADGAGALDIHAGLQSEDGAVSAFAPSSTTYGVAADGALTVSGGSLVGGVSPTGDFAIYAGGTAGGSAPQAWFLLR